MGRHGRPDNDEPEGAVEQLSSSSSSSSTQQRGRHGRLHIESDAPAPVAPTIAGDPLEALGSEPLAFLEGLFEGFDKRMDALERRLDEMEGRRLADLERLLGVHQENDAKDHSAHATRVQTLEDKLGNVLERLEALESLEAATREAAATAKRGK